jgi:hypothetical protein
LDQPDALTLDYHPYAPVGTVRGRALVRVRPPRHGRGTVLRLRRYLPRLTSLRCRDLAQDGSALGPERDPVPMPNADPRNLDWRVDLTPGLVTPEYRLEWELDPAADPTIGVDGKTLLLFRVYLLDRGQDGAEEIQDQGLITVEWTRADDLFGYRLGGPAGR